MATRKKGLGRGLDILLGDLAEPIESQTHALKELPIEFLKPSSYQPRKDMNPERLQELAHSIKAQGIIQAIVVRFIAIDEYEIVAGERRWRAAQLAGLQHVPVIIKEIDDKAAMAIALIENIQREDLNALEESEALQRLIELFNLTHQQAGDAVGKSRATVTNLLRLADLQPEVKTQLGQGLLEMGHGRALLALKETAQIAVANKVIKQGLTVRATEHLIKTLNQPKSDKPVIQKDTNTIKLQENLTQKIGAEVIINHKNSGKGQLVISYNSLEELDGIIDHFGS